MSTIKSSQQSKQIKESDFYKIAHDLFPGGVNSPVRSFSGVNLKQQFVSRANGPYVFSSDNQRYLDFIGSWGPMLLGHNNPKIRDNVIKAAGDGLSFGVTNPKELKLGELIKNYMPSIEMLRFVNSGTEATMSAIRVARAYTNRSKIIKFTGNYHGHVDSMLINSGSGTANISTSSSDGIPNGVVQDTLVADYQDLSSVKQLFSQFTGQIAAVIIEPIAGNMGMIIPKREFLLSLQALCRQHGTVLIFDEVMTGFRVSLGGAQQHFGITPDLTCLGKIIGGGMPVGAFGGKRELMQLLAPCGNVYQAGTLSGNPIAMAAGIALLEQLTPEIYTNINEKVKYFFSLLDNLPIELVTNSLGGMFGVFFGCNQVDNYKDVRSLDQDFFSGLYQYLFKHKILWPPSLFEACFISTMHEMEHMQYTAEVISEFVATKTCSPSM